MLGLLYTGPLSVPVLVSQCQAHREYLHGEEEEREIVKGLFERIGSEVMPTLMASTDFFFTFEITLCASYCFMLVSFS